MLDKKQLFELNPREYIIQNREIGKSDQIIYNELTTRFSDKKAISKLILGTPLKEDKEKFKIYNTILFILLLISVGLKIFGQFEFASSFVGGSSIINIILTSIFSWGVYNYLKTIYKIGGILSVFGVVISIWYFSNLTYGISILNILLTGVIAGLFFFLDLKLFPKKTFSEN